MIYRIGCNVNVLLLAVSNQVVLSQKRVALNLVGGRDNAGRLDDSFKLVKTQLNSLLFQYCSILRVEWSGWTRRLI